MSRREFGNESRVITPDQGLRRLDGEQLSQFDTHYIAGTRIDAIDRLIERQFPGGEFTVLDVGGGNGTFVDQLLDRHPGAQATLVDNADTLLAVNRAHPRKRIVRGSVEEIGGLFAGEKFDLISFNFSIHHFVSDNYAHSRLAQAVALREARSLLSDRGRISIFENVCEGYVVPSFSGWLIYRLTAARSIAPLVRRMGANTAGCGVLFLSENAIRKDAAQAGLDVLDVEPDPHDKPLAPLKRKLLLMRIWRVKLFWLSPQRERMTPELAAIEFATPADHHALPPV